jgi:hypothetical protein
MENDFVCNDSIELNKYEGESENRSQMEVKQL